MCIRSALSSVGSGEVRQPRSRGRVGDAEGVPVEEKEVRRRSAGEGEAGAVAQ